MRIEDDAESWESIGTLAAREIERCVLTNELASAQQLADSIAGAVTGERTALHADRAARPGPAGRRRVLPARRRATAQGAGGRGRGAQPPVPDGRGVDGAAAGRNARQRGPRPHHPPAARAADRLRCGRAPGRGAAQELAQPRRAPHRRRSAAGVRRQRGAARADGDARRRRPAGAAGFHPRHRPDWHEGGLRNAGAGLRLERRDPGHGGARARVAARSQDHSAALPRADQQRADRHRRGTARSHHRSAGQPARTSRLDGGAPRRRSTGARGGRRYAPRGCATPRPGACAVSAPTKRARHWKRRPGKAAAASARSPSASWRR